MNPGTQNMRKHLLLTLLLLWTVVPLSALEIGSKISSFSSELAMALFTVVFLVVMGIVSTATSKKNSEILQKALAEAEKATALKDALLANISHEIRTPMNAIVGFTHLLMQSEVTDKQYETLFKIKSSSNMLLNIVNDILDFSKIEAGKIAIEKIEFNINSVLEQVSDIVSIKAKAKKIAVIFHIDAGVPASILGDPLRLTQVLINLLDNGVKFSEKGDVLLNIKVITVEEGVEKLQFEVIDSGIGMKEDQRKYLFQPFIQADSSTSRKFGGTGLGLNISKSLVELMGGSIVVESEYGEGSRFAFTIDLERGIENNLRNYRLPSKRLMDKNVLIVDNNKKSIDALSAMLGYFHYTSSFARDTKELRKVLADDSFDIIIVNDQMIRLCLDGSILHRCKSKIVLMEESFHREKSIDKLHIDAYLSKPFNQQMIFDIIVTLFDTTKQERKSQKQRYQHEDLLVLEGSRILLAEDNFMNQAVVEGLLEETGILITNVMDGQKAVEEIIKNGNYDLILMDINMPIMDGYKASSIIREYPQFEDIPIIALSANLKQEDHLKAKEVGMQDYLNKPIDVESFYKLLLHYIPAKVEAPQKEPVSDTMNYEDEKVRMIRILKSIDVLEGLKRLNDNVKAYRKILFDFSDAINTSRAEFKQILQQTRYSEGQDLAHYYKGIAGNLGVDRLHKILKNLEEAFSEKDKSACSILLNQFNDETLKVVQETTILKQQSEAVKAPRMSISEEMMITLMVQLRTYAKKGKALQTKELIEMLKGYSWSGSKKLLFDKIVYSAKMYNFKDTVHYIDAMKKMK